MKSEKEKQLKLLEKMSSNKDKSSKEKLNIEKATNKHIAEEANNESSRYIFVIKTRLITLLTIFLQNSI